MAEMYSSHSPFTYVLNNPVKFIDPTGMWVETDTGYHTDDPDEIADWWDKNVGSSNQSDNNDSGDEKSEKDEDENSLKDNDLETTNTYTIYGETYSISNSNDYSGKISHKDGLTFWHDKAGNITLVLANGRLLTGQDIISYIVRNRVDSNGSFISRLSLALSGDKDSGNSTYKGPYKGLYKGPGQGTSLGTRYGHIEGVLGVLDFLEWMQNNPQEVEKMQQEWYNYLKSVENK